MDWLYNMQIFLTASIRSRPTIQGSFNKVQNCSLLICFQVPISTFALIVDMIGMTPHRFSLWYVE